MGQKKEKCIQQLIGLRREEEGKETKEGREERTGFLGNCPGYLTCSTLLLGSLQNMEHQRLAEVHWGLKLVLAHLLCKPGKVFAFLCHSFLHFKMIMMNVGYEGVIFLIPAVRRQRHVDFCDSEASVVYSVSSKIARLHDKTWSQNKTKQTRTKDSITNKKTPSTLYLFIPQLFCVF